MISAERAREVLAYDPATGELRWRVDRCAQIKAGDIAGTRNAAGYISVNCLGRRYLAHRLIWLIWHGEEPPPVVDHIDCDGTNNRIENLRAADKSKNSANSLKPPRAKTGIRGVTKRYHRWHANIRCGDQRHYLGSFPTAHAAKSAYEAAKVRLFGEFARVS